MCFINLGEDLLELGLANDNLGLQWIVSLDILEQSLKPKGEINMKITLAI